jgi:hypothetical protein
MASHANQSTPRATPPPLLMGGQPGVKPTGIGSKIRIGIRIWRVVMEAAFTDWVIVQLRNRQIRTAGNKVVAGVDATLFPAGFTPG